MADQGLLQALDYILNHSDGASVDVIAEAVTRRRRDLTVFEAIGEIPNPEKMAKEISASLGDSTKKIMDGMKSSIHEMIVRLLREHAPELNESQIDELCEAWMPSHSGKNKNDKSLPPDVLLSMVEQFVSFSHGNMSKSVDKELRDELGAWPERYWNSFPTVIRQIIKDYLGNKITEKEYKNKILIAIG